MPTASTYSKLRAAASVCDEWPADRVMAIQVLGVRSPGDLVDALLAEGASEEAAGAHSAR